MFLTNVAENIKKHILGSTAFLRKSHFVWHNVKKQSRTGHRWYCVCA